MLKKENRLNKVFSQGKKISTPLFNINISENSSGSPRFAFIVSKKVDRRAVVRNKAKRKVRSIIEEQLLKIGKGRDFIFYLKPESIAASRDQILEEVKQIFK